MTDKTPDRVNRGNCIFFKFEYDGTQYEMASLTTDDTVGNLRAVVCSMLNIDNFEKITLKTLQPTKILDTSYDSTLLVDIFRGIRERIIVEDAYTATSSDKNIDELDHLLKQSTSRIPSKPGIKHHKSDAFDFEEHQLFKPENSAYEAPSSDLHEELSLNRPDASTTSNESPIRQRKIPREQLDYPVCSSTGYLLRHPVPANNSCLFISVHFCLTNGVVDDQIGKSMRKIIAETVASDKQHFDDAFLGKSNADYCKWILDDNNWGGAIELSILCKYYETEIVAIDVKNTILNRFGEDSHYPQRMLLLYDGLHYDPLKFQPVDDNQQIQTLFSTDNIEVLHLAEELALEAKQAHQFTDINTISMRCASCNVELDAKSAPEHAAKTGHVDFIEK